jgi:hypothetical protein
MPYAGYRFIPNGREVNISKKPIYDLPTWENGLYVLSRIQKLGPGTRK